MRTFGCIQAYQSHQEKHRELANSPAHGGSSDPWGPALAELIQRADRQSGHQAGQTPSVDSTLRLGLLKLMPPATACVQHGGAEADAEPPARPVPGDTRGRQSHRVPPFMKGQPPTLPGNFHFLGSDGPPCPRPVCQEPSSCAHGTPFHGPQQSRPETVVPRLGGLSVSQTPPEGWDTARGAPGYNVIYGEHQPSFWRSELEQLPRPT